MTTKERKGTITLERYTIKVKRSIGGQISIKDLPSEVTMFEQDLESLIQEMQQWHPIVTQGEVIIFGHKFGLVLESVLHKGTDSIDVFNKNTKFFKQSGYHLS